MDIWTNEWNATCDDRCPFCDTSCSPIESKYPEPFPEGEPCTLTNDVKPWRFVRKSLRRLYGRRTDHVALLCIGKHREARLAPC
jgi:hypothetical protein